MANVIKKVANADGTHTYLESVNTPEYPTADWLINPDVSALSAVPRKHWKVSGASVVEMSVAEKAVIDTPKTPTGDTIHLKSEDGGIFRVDAPNAGGAPVLVKIN